MKLLVVTCINESKKNILDIFKKCGIKIFSASGTTGFKEDHELNLLNDWFGNKEGEYDSMLFFSFTDTKSALAVIESIRQYNINISKASSFPAHAFMIAVEASAEIIN